MPKFGLTTSTFLLWLAAHCMMTMVLERFDVFANQTQVVYAQLGQWGVLTIAYLFLFGGRTRPQVSPALAAIAVMIAGILTPSILQTDQIRYVWDGYVGSRFYNPYMKAPMSLPEFDSWFWLKNLNHPHLRTIYPPFAQINFAISTGFNPFFWSDLFGFGFGPPTKMWQAEFGWHTWSAIWCGLLVWHLRHRRWDLLALNPLFLLMAIGNAHLELIFAAAMGFALTWGYRRLVVVQNAWIFAAIMTKWIPAMFLPLFALRWWRLGHGRSAVLSTVMFAALAAGAVIGYNYGTRNGVFDSLLTFSRHWYFLGYLHRWLSELIGLVTNVGDPVHLARQICGGMFVIFAAAIFFWQWRCRRPVALSCLIIYTGYLALSPTLHPWYLLPLLMLGLRFTPYLWTPALWSLLLPATVLYYVENKDPVLLRHGIYIVITLTLLRDARLIWRRGIPAYRSIQSSPPP